MFFSKNLRNPRGSIWVQIFPSKSYWFFATFWLFKVVVVQRQRIKDMGMTIISCREWSWEMSRLLLMCLEVNLFTAIWNTWGLSPLNAGLGHLEKKNSVKLLIYNCWMTREEKIFTKEDKCLSKFLICRKCQKFAVSVRAVCIQLCWAACVAFNVFILLIVHY